MENYTPKNQEGTTSTNPEDQGTVNNEQATEWSKIAKEVPFAGTQRRTEKTFAELNDEHHQGERDGKEIYDEEQRLAPQTDDAEILAQYCDINQVQEIINSDNYGVLLENDVSITQLFDRDILFNEQYYEDGYTADYDWRYDYADRMPRGVVGGAPDSNSKRTEETLRAIDIVANTYLGENVPSSEKDEFKQILKESPDSLNDEQKAFLRRDFNEVSDRLLYGPQVTSKERAEDIKNGLIKYTKEYDDWRSEHQDGHVDEDEPWTAEEQRDRFVSRLSYAALSIEDYNARGKSDLVDDARWELHEAASDNVWDILTAQQYAGDYDDEEARRLIIQKYIRPKDLAKTANKDYEHQTVFRDKLEDLGMTIDDIVQGAKNAEFADTTLNSMSYLVKDYKELGASDEAVLGLIGDDNIRGHLYAGEFMSADRPYEGIGTRFLEAGVDRKAVLSKVYNSQHNRDAFRSQEGPYFDNKNWFDIMSEQGFNATEIAETFAPDDIVRRLPEFLEHGADAKELTKYMLSYRERYEDDLRINENGEREYISVPKSGTYNVRIYDKNHQGGHTIKKEMLAGENGIGYVGISLDILADNGVTEEDIINNMPKSESEPKSFFFGKMLECKKFDPAKILELGYQRYIEYLEKMQEKGYFDEEFVKMVSDKGKYYVDAMEQQSEFFKKQRSNFYGLFSRHLEEVEEKEKKS